MVAYAMYSAYITIVAQEQPTVILLKKTVSAVAGDTVNNLLHLDVLLSELAFDLVQTLFVHKPTSR